MKYFYTEPLAARWMGKHFGMKFQETTTFNEEGRVVFVCGKIYIHPDSLDLLEQITGDLIIKDNSAYFINNIMGNSRINSDMQIIQRKGIHFMWPESEA